MINVPFIVCILILTLVAMPHPREVMRLYRSLKLKSEAAKFCTLDKYIRCVMGSDGEERWYVYTNITSNWISVTAAQVVSVLNRVHAINTVKAVAWCRKTSYNSVSITLK